METMGMKLSGVKQSFFGPPGQYGRRVTSVNSERFYKEADTNYGITLILSFNEQVEL